jgi:hypothetical protein
MILIYLKILFIILRLISKSNSSEINIVISTRYICEYSSKKSITASLYSIVRIRRRPTPINGEELIVSKILKCYFLRYICRTKYFSMRAIESGNTLYLKNNLMRALIISLYCLPIIIFEIIRTSEALKHAVKRVY